MQSGNRIWLTISLERLLVPTVYSAVVDTLALHITNYSPVLLRRDYSCFGNLLDYFLVYFCVIIERLSAYYARKCVCNTLQWWQLQLLRQLYDKKHRNFSRNSHMSRCRYHCNKPRKFASNIRPSSQRGVQADTLLARSPYRSPPPS